MMCSILAATACASSNPPAASGPAPVETVRLVDGGGMLTMTTTPSGGSMDAAVPMALDQVWRRLPVVFDSLGIPIGMVDPTAHTIGNPSYRLRRRVGTVALSKYINCGSAQGMSSADTYEISLSVVTQARSTGAASTTLSTTVAASGHPITQSGDDVRCTSTGTLERKILEMVTGRPSH